MEVRGFTSSRPWEGVFVSGHTSAQEVRDQSVAAMGKPLGELYFALRNELAWLHIKWKDFVTLFADKDAVNLLNDAALGFFRRVQDMMWEDTLLHLCRLTDPPKSARKDTLTIRQLPQMVTDAALSKLLQELADDACDKTKFARDWRNRRLAHKELPPLDGSPSAPLATATRQHVDEALLAITSAVNCVEHHYLKCPVLYHYVIEGLGGVEALLHHLRKSARSKRRP